MNISDIFSILTHKILPVFFGIAGVGFVIAFHEFGHLIFCKIFNIKAPSFSIGFGPRVITKKIGETEFSLSAIPLGGYLEIAGSAEIGQGEQAEAYSTDDRSFGPRPWIQKFLVVSGGIIFNILLAYIIFSLLYLVGMPQSMILYPKNATAIVKKVEPNSPADQAGIKPDDIVLSIDDISLQTSVGPTLVKTIQAYPNKQLSFRIQRDGKIHEINLTTGKTSFLGKTLGTAGIIFAPAPLAPVSFINSIKMGIQLTHEYSLNTINGFKHIFAKRDTSMVGGPVTIFAETIYGAQQGFKFLLLFLAMISISLAIINLLPYPILDGGQIVYYTIESIIGRSIPEKVREYIHIVCWIALLLLTIYLSYKDIVRLAQPYIEQLWNFLGWKK